MDFPDEATVIEVAVVAELISCEDELADVKAALRLSTNGLIHSAANKAQPVRSGIPQTGAEVYVGAGEALADFHRAFDDWEQQVIGQFLEEIEWLVRTGIVTLEGLESVF